MVRIAVSNLIRNAIENTDVGFVEIVLSQGRVAVIDSGSGFDPVEAARRYRDSLRQPAPMRGQGLGLFLIGRICERFRWTLGIDSGARGTRATLDMSASVVEVP
nr:sensor histidine kinase [Stenotrophomonas maltophilia]